MNLFRAFAILPARFSPAVGSMLLVRRRVPEGSYLVPDSLWIVLVPTAIVVSVYMLFLADSAERTRSHGDGAAPPYTSEGVQVAS